MYGEDYDGPERYDPLEPDYPDEDVPQFEDLDASGCPLSKEEMEEDHSILFYYDEEDWY